MSWISTPEKDVSFEHCGRPAYWEGEQVICSKCQETMTDPKCPRCGIASPSVLLDQDNEPYLCDDCWNEDA